MAYYSKYTGKELEERLDRINDIPALIDKLFLNKEYLTELEVKCLIKEMIPLFYKDIPIDNKTIYWDNGVLKSVCTGEGNNEEEEEEDYQCLWELREHNGQQYIYSKLPVVTQYGITIYGDNGDIDLPSLYAGLPIDNQTIYWDNGVLKSLGGGGGEGLDEEALRNYLLINGYVTRDELPSLNGYATESWVLNLGYIGPEGLKNYVDISSNQDINGKKNFKSGISINGLDIYQSQDDVIYLDANLVVRGGITMYSINEVDIPSIIDYIPTASTTTKGIASFDESFFTVDSNGKVSLINSSSGGGIDETELEAYLTSNNYAKKSDIPSLVGYATESWVNTRIDSLINGAPAAYDTLKEIADVLQGNVNSIGDIITALGTKWTQDNTKIANWDTAYSWGNHATAGYALKTYVDSELTKYVTLSGEQTISGKKNFTTGGLFINGNQIIYDSTKKYWKLEGDLLVTGGITMYGSSVSGGSAGATTLGQLQNVGNWADSVADVDRIMYQAAGSSNWVAKSLSSIGGGVSGDYLPLSGGTITNSSIGLTINRSANTTPWIAFQINGVDVGRLGSELDKPIWYDVQNWKANTILHESNYSQYALPISGGTINGQLSLGKVGTTDNLNYYVYRNNAYTAVGVSGNNNSYILNNYNNSNYILHFGSNGLKYQIGNETSSVLTGTNFDDYALPLTGGTLDGVLTLRASNSSSDSWIAFSNKSDSVVHKLGIRRSESLYGLQYYNGSEYFNIWHSGNDGSGSGLDADLLDGLESWNYPHIYNNDSYDLNTHLNTACNTFIVRVGGSNPNLPPQGGYGNLLNVQGPSSDTSFQLFGCYSVRRLFFRSGVTGYDKNGLTTTWKEIAFIDSNVASATIIKPYQKDSGEFYIVSGTRSDNTQSRGIYDNGWNLMIDNGGIKGVIASVNHNVASATKLQTARTIWGQSFDGTGNVDGALTITGGSNGRYVKITGDAVNFNAPTSGAYAMGLDMRSNSGTYYGGICGAYGSTQSSIEYYYYGGAYNSATMYVKGGNVGIGTTSPSSRLSVSGTMNVTGATTLSSTLSVGSTLTIKGNESNDIRTVINSNSAITTNSPATAAAIRHSIEFKWYDTAWQIGNVRGNGTDSIGFGITSNNSALRFVVKTSGATCYGNFLATGGITMYGSSDKRLKKNIRTFNASEELMKLGGVYQFEYNDTEIERNNTYKGTHVGLIYQNVKGTILDKMCYEREDGYGALNYLDTSFISLIAAVGIEHETRIQKLERENKELRQEVERLKRA